MLEMMKDAHETNLCLIQESRFGELLLPDGFKIEKVLKNAC
jgi:hypothetical protein